MDHTVLLKYCVVPYTYNPSNGTENWRVARATLRDPVSKFHQPKRGHCDAKGLRKKKKANKNAVLSNSSTEQESKKVRSRAARELQSERTRCWLEGHRTCQETGGRTKGPSQGLHAKEAKEQEPKSHNKVLCGGSLRTVSAVWREQERCFQDVGKRQIKETVSYSG